MNASIFIRKGSEFKVVRDGTVAGELDLKITDREEGYVNVYFMNEYEGEGKSGADWAKELADAIYLALDNRPKKVHVDSITDQQLIHCPSCDQPIVFVQDPAYYVCKEHKEGGDNPLICIVCNEPATHSHTGDMPREDNV